ncbi:hypothetical protein SOVF_188150 [Spinacia oleracea]|nr:hypothetical protein SOVF_188150 [Spinacia oleracea]
MKKRSVADFARNVEEGGMVKSISNMDHLRLRIAR